MPQKRNWRKYLLEFLSIFIAVISAFALNNWNEQRRDNNAEQRILSEIAAGLEKDLADIRLNKMGHEMGMKAIAFWQNIFTDQPANLDSLTQHYYILNRDFISIQNTSGYENLKSRGLELVKDDSLRTRIVALYEYDYKSLLKLEEDYTDLQFAANYFPVFNRVIAPALQFDVKGNIAGIRLPLPLTPTERNILQSYLWKMRVNRSFAIRSYGEVEEAVEGLHADIEVALK